MLYKKTYLALLACSLVACSKSKKNTTKDDDPASLNSLSVSIEGDINKQIHLTGTDVGVGLLGFTKTNLKGFALVANVIVNGKSVLTANSGLATIPFTTGVEQKAAPGGVSQSTGNSTKNYSGMDYFLFYDTDPNQKNSMTYITLRQVQDTANLLKISGEFHFNAASSSSNLSDACTTEAIAHSGRIPMYNPDVCGATKLRVTGTFTVYLDKKTQQP
ncbi:hypothetical protein FHW36_11198 [Chitinophaga polysaccharea]|uniref:Uncharacterized protein n=1 Tax=Chitinophaga polysaccharea TaxID=1293035 RepID=A0A561P721_9BACT|nr:hypothetical protein [Chitinophaga polysaccharea]TWF33907.1 hypothetical protein FHW36_11198 [Chitinophaga polysaccharea]